MQHNSPEVKQYMWILPLSRLQGHLASQPWAESWMGPPLQFWPLQSHSHPQTELPFQNLSLVVNSMGLHCPQEKAPELRFSGGSPRIWSGMISPLPSLAAPSITPAITIVRALSLACVGTVWFPATCWASCSSLWDSPMGAFLLTGPPLLPPAARWAWASPLGNLPLWLKQVMHKAIQVVSFLGGLALNPVKETGSVFDSSSGWAGRGSRTTLNVKGGRLAQSLHPRMWGPTQLGRKRTTRPTLGPQQHWLWVRGGDMYLGGFHKHYKSSHVPTFSKSLCPILQKHILILSFTFYINVWISSMSLNLNKKNIWRKTFLGLW